MSGSASQLHMLRSKEALDAAGVSLTNGFRCSSIHCAYFAMFHAATAMGLAKGKKYPACSGWLKAFEETVLGASDIDRRFYVDLLKAYELRQIADYDTAQQIPVESAQQTLASAAEFVAMAEKFIEGTGGSIE